MEKVFAIVVTRRDSAEPHLFTVKAGNVIDAKAYVKKQFKSAYEFMYDDIESEIKSGKIWFTIYDIDVDSIVKI